MSVDPRLEQMLDMAEAESVETRSVQADTREIIALLRVDCEFFIEFFLADLLDMPVPDFHVEIWSLLTSQEKERVLLGIPRDHAKTTLAKLCVVWYWLFTPFRFCVYLSNTNAIAKGACKDIIEYLSHPNFVEVFGKVNMIKASENESLWMFELVTPSGKKKKCILRAIGQGQQMRGINIDNVRPEIAVIDDVEDNENTSSELQQKALDKWVFGPFLKALARKKKILWLGNMLAKTSLLARLSRSHRWNPVVFGALVKDQVTQKLQPLWPGKWSVESLQEDLQEYKTNGLLETWMCEMMNMPGHSENGFTAEQINYEPVPTPDSVQAAFITVDPAFGKNAHNDESAIAVHVIPKDGVPITAVVSHGKWDEHEMFMEILQLATYWNAWSWGIESVAAQRTLIPYFNLLAASKGITDNIEIVPLMSGRGDPKMSRMRSYVALMAAKEWAIGQDDVDLTTQILEIDFGKKEQPDDILDSAAYGPPMMDQFLGLIMAQAAGFDHNSHKPRTGTEIANV